MSEARRIAEPRIIVALDHADVEAATALAESLSPGRCRLKVGKELFTRAGPDVVARLRGRGFEIFLDLKFHDIPNTVAGACRAAADLGVWMVDVHAAGGRRMLEAAREALHGGPEPPLLVAVTLLTSLDGADLRETGIEGEPAEQVRRLAVLAAQCGLDGVVCSPADLPVLRGLGPPSFLRVTPGVRPRNAAQGDQKRVMTPGEAIRSGADFLVIGRPVTRAADPAAALAEIQAELEEAG